MAFNISKLALADSFELKLLDPRTSETLVDDETGKPVTINLFSTSSKQYRNVVTGMQNARLKNEKAKLSAEKLREDSIEILVACSDSSDSLELDGLKFNAVDNSAAFRKLYSAPEYSWIREQVDNALGDVSNFLTQ